MTKEERIEKLIESLRGTCDSMTTKAEDLDLDDLDEAVTGAVDEAIFCCASCGWWCEQDEEASEEYDLDEWTCRDCASLE